MSTAHNGPRAEDIGKPPLRPTDPAGPPDLTPEPADDASPEDIESDIARTRRELANTVSELSRKLDPTTQAQHQVEDIASRVRGQAEHARQAAQSSISRARDAATGDDGRPAPTAWITLGAGVGILVGLVAIGALRAR